MEQAEVGDTLESSIMPLVLRASALQGVWSTQREFEMHV